ncbi:hypothetical protein [Lysobacter sp. F6437]|uniref:hypothetical protein n=1 Tax=Lysobacter sp. F6437 TaxID=3459296 RepID=UPI00403DE21D
MADDTLMKQLRSWGFAQVNRYDSRAANDEDRHSTRNHPITKAREFAPMTVEKAAHRLIGRDGSGRRRFMAARAGVDAMKITPVWAVDHIRCTDDRIAGPGASSAAVDKGTPEDLRWIDRAISQLSRESQIRALVLREEFCGTGTQRRKADAVAVAYGGKFSVWMYRRELQRAMDWLEGKRAA